MRTYPKFHETRNAVAGLLSVVVPDSIARGDRGVRVEMNEVLCLGTIMDGVLKCPIQLKFVPSARRNLS